MSSNQDILQRIEALVLPLCEESGLDLYDLDLQPGRKEAVIRITVDRKGAAAPGDGVTIGEIASLTRQLNYQLDVEDFIPFAYRLEVSSPGIERELTRAPHFERHVGDEVRVVLRAPTEDGWSVLEGVLKSFDGFELSVACNDGVERKTHLEAVKRAKTVYDFDGKGVPKSPKKKK